ncbi:cation diffusion facilitator family transporter [Undibacterium fentianense]|uniref:Cation transporter n=1 Tax=Undibacterium fentianense TaxID=2828728 RepID=A0A941E0R3_9BURK|nr:cation diffusion facilitator family transporter [Undibacterium fentianense]MBR7800240.1 cation transporter [Undibacterium fentianense]
MPHDTSPTPVEKGQHLHAHRHGDAEHQHYFADRSQSVLAWALGLTLFFAAIEVIFGVLSNSLALISDAGHMVTDSAALGLALLAQLIAKRPPTAKHTFGFGRSEALAAFVNGLVMLGVIVWISFEALQRLATPEKVQGGVVMVVATIGLFINIIVAWVLSHDKESMNTKAALIHVMGDLLGSVAAIISGAIIYYTGWMPIDPILSIFVSLLILKSTIGVLKESFHFLMKGVPTHIDFLQIGTDLETTAGVASVHDLHIWEMSPGQPALIGHLEIDDLSAWPRILESIKKMLLEKHGIDHITLQPEVLREENDYESASCNSEH